MAGKKARAGAPVEARPRKRARESMKQPVAEGGAPPLVTDGRFAALQWDPRFSRVPKRATKLPVDDRFKDALVGNPAFRGSSAPVDRFGRPKVHKGKDAALARLYDIGSSSEDGSGDEDDDEDDDGEGDAVGERKIGVMGMGLKRGDGSEGSGASGVESESDGDAAAYASDSQCEEEEEREVIVRGEATRRLAVMGLDWSNARAVDVFVSLQSFCPPGKALKEVKVHPSKFGLERLALEAKMGPQVLQPMDLAFVEELRGAGGDEDANGKDANDEGNDGENGEDSADGEEAAGGNEIGIEGGSDGGDDIRADSDEDEESDASSEDEDDIGGVMETALDVDDRKQQEQSEMRKYEEDRLKYYYAVAEFEDVKTADAVYEQCDGVEYETTGLAFDLRFVPDDMVIDAPVRDSVDCVPDGYVPPNLAPSTLNNCKVKLSWDADAPDRAVLKKRTVGRHEEDEENLKAYLASPSESENEVDEGEVVGAMDAAAKKKELESKRRLLLGDDGFADDDDGVNDEDMEMEVTFEPGLQEKGEDIVKRKHAREEVVDETAWEARLRRMQERKSEKRKARKEQFGKEAGGDAAEDGSVDDSENSMYGDVVDNPRFKDDPFFTSALSDEEGAAAMKRGKEIPGKEKRGKSKKSREKRDSKVTGEASDDAVSSDDEHAAENARQKANLELIMLDDDRKKGATSLRDRLVAADSDDDGAGDERMKKQKKKRSRGRRRSDREAAAAAAVREAPASAMDVGDERFSSLFSSHLFAMDPTHPKFKRNETTERILKEKTRRGGSTAASAAAASRAGTDAKAGAPEKSSGGAALREGGGDDVMGLVASIKAKSKATRKGMVGRSSKKRA